MPGRRYEVTVSGHLGPAVADSFAPLNVRSAGGLTVISGEVLDAAMLSGVLRKVEAFGLTLIEVRSNIDDQD